MQHGAGHAELGEDRHPTDIGEQSEVGTLGVCALRDPRVNAALPTTCLSFRRAQILMKPIGPEYKADIVG